MKFDCPECGAAVEPEWVRARAGRRGVEVGGKDVEVKCSSCGVVTVCPASKLAPPPAERSERNVTCPKCGHLQSATEACDRCGLVFSRYDPARAEAPSDEAARALWQAVLAAWDDDARHRGFIEYCTTMGLYAYAAQQYGQQRREPPREQRAARELSRLVLLAQQALLATKPPGVAASIQRIKRVLLVIALVLCASMLLFVLSRVAW